MKAEQRLQHRPSMLRAQLEAPFESAPLHRHLHCQASRLVLDEDVRILRDLMQVL